MHFVYILQCNDDSYYVGLTQDVTARLNVHNSGTGPAFTVARPPVRLVHKESFETLESAVRREKQLKGWSRAKKEALVAGKMKRLSELAACRGKSPAPAP